MSKRYSSKSIPPKPNERALTESMQSSEQSSNEYESNPNHHRKSVVDIASTFQKMENKLKRKKKTSNNKSYLNHKRKSDPIPKSKQNHPKIIEPTTAKSASFTTQSMDEDKADILIERIKKNKISRLEKALIEKNKEIEDLKNNKINKLEEELDERSSEIIGLQKLVKEQQNTFKQRTNSFKMNDQNIKNELMDLKEDITSYKNQNISMKKELISMKKELGQYQTENKILKQKINELSNQNRMENHVLNIAKEDELKTKIKKLQAELSKCKSVKLGRILKIERYQNEIRMNKQILNETKSEIHGFMNQFMHEMEQNFIGLLTMMPMPKTDDILIEDIESDINSFHDQNTQNSEIETEIKPEPKRKSVFEQAVGSLDTLFDGKIEAPKSNLTKLIENTNIDSNTRSLSPSPIMKEDDIEHDRNRESYHNMQEIRDLSQQIHEREEELQHKEEMLNRLSEENKIFQEQIRDLREQLHFEEKFNEMNQSQHHIEQILETLNIDKQTNNKQMHIIQTQLNQILQQNHVLKQSMDSKYNTLDQMNKSIEYMKNHQKEMLQQNNALHQLIHQRHNVFLEKKDKQNESSDKSVSMDKSVNSVASESVRDIPINMRAMKAPRFSEIFLQQLQSSK